MGDLLAIVRAPKTAEDVQNIELWRAGGLQKTFNLKEADLHGKIYTDGEFGSLRLSTDLASLLYVAEVKKTKNVSFLSQGEVPAGAMVGQEAAFRCWIMIVPAPGVTGRSGGSS